MRDVFLGLLAVLTGAVFCFRGYLTMRVVIPVWGVFSGFAFGAGLIAQISDVRFLSTFLGWIVGAAIGLVFGTLAYLYFEVSVLIGMTTIGFILGASLMVALNVTWTWVIVLVGIGAGVFFAAIALAGDLPMVLLTVLTALAGASAIVGGTMLLVGTLHADDLTQAGIVDRIHEGAGWWVLYVALAIIGMGSQISALGSMRQTLREEWASERGRDAATTA